MKIKNTTKPPVIKQGRPIIYPFDKIGPGQQLTIDGTGSSLKQKRQSVANSLKYYKDKTASKWDSVVTLEGFNIVVYRLN